MFVILAIPISISIKETQNGNLYLSILHRQSWSPTQNGKIIGNTGVFYLQLLTFPEHLSSPPVFSGVHVTLSLVLCVCFIDRCLSFCPISLPRLSV
jgi:hypothetical protein